MRSNSSVCVKMKCDGTCLYAVYQLSMLMSIDDNEILTLSRIDMSILSVNFSYVCLIYAEIFEKMSSGGLEVSFNIS